MTKAIKDDDIFTDTEKLAEFKRTVEFRELATTDESCNNEICIVKSKLQQKWINELGESEWRDIPLVISDK